MYVGSRLLSQLAAAGVSAAEQTGAQLVFPTDSSVTDDNAVVPHRFAFLTEYESAGVVAHVRDAVMDSWRVTADAVRDWLLRQRWNGDTRSMLDAFERTKDNWLEFYWVGVPYEDKWHGASLKRANDALAQRKNMRHFPQVAEPDWKCTLTGASSALPLPSSTTLNGYREMRNAWGTFAAALATRTKTDVREIVIRPNEMLGTLALVKRLAQHAMGDELGFDTERFPSTRHIGGKPEEEASRGREVEAYFAILHMDGDKMGDKLSQLTQLEQHQQVSHALAQFARDSVTEIVTHYDREARKTGARAKLVYAGGDDVLALLPLPSVLACANDIRIAYAEMLGEFVANPTMSAGIAILSSNYPLDMGLEVARRAEQRAKRTYGRDAVVVTEVLSIGQRTAGAKWVLPSGQTITALVDDLISHFQEPNPQLSAKLGFDLSEIVAYALVGEGMEDARDLEVRRLLKRRASERLTDTQRQALINTLAPQLVAWGEHLPDGWRDVANWVIFARFLASGGKEQG